ncbi:MAG: nickel-responsive transcriptional regulator NikR [Candidatus Omnitrophica bacterium]|nr:nickel-responsive transcriptional regulator NikR [Candidatus Omnitrophota bacterium]MDD5487842.1 nickel-responsive transcriptional regulator NikR [Candidatus Omnitrophota bacterium]
MGKVVRFGVSLEKELLSKFDAVLKKEKYPTRSEAIRDLVRDKLVKKEWGDVRGDVAGTITLVYDHHKRELLNTLTDLQHDHHGIIISAQHVHLDHNNCLEIIIVKGRYSEIDELASCLKSAKGVKFGHLSLATTGKNIS